jgi:hypothetical protein
MNSRIVDIRRSFPLSETFPKLQTKKIDKCFAKDTGGLPSCHVNIYQLPRVNLLLKLDKKCHFSPLLRKGAQPTSYCFVY